MAVIKVWIEEGCTLCGLCEDECPEVFEIGDESAVVKEDVDIAEFGDDIMNAVESCPVQVILYEEQ
ncbi:MAG: ferredoxin [Gemmatimonadota bacterium]|nr:ferredoxin [Gemmatimonadota bacterium]